ncbi:MAG: hypothetical protein A2901_00395 [Elusimicrobia bacterium RIFCSPLOWO2_01_FULL_54_10]|nr:MAG: hypothetical protein A2901_00395 [Elusimicrobia bacterium RIFCSPLOWO2_01_FULL_54_10]
MSLKSRRIVTRTGNRIYYEDEFVPARRRINLTSGDMIRFLREAKEWTQEELARRSGISATNLSLLENDRVDIGKKRAFQIAKAFGVHPATIMYPGIQARDISQAA